METELTRETGSPITNICGLLTPQLVPEYVVEFRRFVPVRAFHFERNAALAEPISPDEEDEPPGITQFLPSLGEAPIRKATAYIALELPLRQEWRGQEVVLHDLVSTIGLAPGEKAFFRIRKSQRDRLHRKTVQSKTETFSSESSIVDKEVLAATRNTVASVGLSVSSNGKFSFGEMSEAEISAATDINLTNEINRTSERLHEATRSSSEQLTLTQTVEVIESREVFVEEEERREITNPYKDRSLQLQFFALRKRYNVANVAGERADDGSIQPLNNVKLVLALDFRSLHFGVGFVRDNLAFLEAHLVERDLLGEYRQLLREPDVSFEQEYGKDRERVARIALDYLFRHNGNNGNGIGIFGFPEGDQTNGLIFESFRLEPENTSALNDALPENANVTSLYACLAYYYNLYMDFVRNQHAQTLLYGTFEPDGDPGPLVSHRFDSADEMSQFITDLAVSLADSIQEHLGGVPEEQFAQALDTNQRTEVFRRAPGFLGLMSVVAAPRGGEDEVGRSRNRRLTAIETRITEHLNSYMLFYIQRYVEFITEAMHTVEFQETFRELHPLLQSPDNEGLPSLESLSELFNLESGYIDGTRFIIPSSISGTPAEIGAVLEELLGEDAGTFDFDDVDAPPIERQVSLPVDGVHVEAVPGFCRLPDLPADCETRLDVDLSLKGDTRCVSKSASGSLEQPQTGSAEKGAPDAETDY